MENPIEGIDFSQLKEQKKDLLSVIHSIDEDSRHARYSGYEQYGKELESKSDSLQGILALIDSIQDYAVDVLGEDENEVFDLEGE